MKSHTKHTKEALGRKDADVIDSSYKNCFNEKHYEIDVSSSVFAQGYGDDPSGAFLARPGKDRAQPHKKVNECDH